MQTRFQLVFFIGLAANGLAVAEPVAIELGDPRKTVVSIEDDGSTYSLVVTMPAVKSFDTGSDREANRSLSRVSAIAEDGEEKVTSVVDYLETTQAKLRGATRDFPIIGRWTSDNGTLFTVAVGGFFSRED